MTPHIDIGLARYSDLAFTSTIVVLVIAFSLNQSETPGTPIEGALTLNLAGVLVEQRTQTDPTVQLLRQMEKSDDQPSEIVLSDLLWAIKSAKDDERIKALVPILIPLFISAFRRADELAMAMECRCYRGGDGRTRLKVLRCTRQDYIDLAVCIVCFMVILSSRLVFPNF